MNTDDNATQETKKPTLEEAQAWAERRKQYGETATVLECPCCHNLLAVYIGLCVVILPKNETRHQTKEKTRKDGHFEVSV